MTGQTLSFLGKNIKFAGQMSDDQLLMAEPAVYVKVLLRRKFLFFFLAFFKVDSVNVPTS